MRQPKHPAVLSESLTPFSSFITSTMHFQGNHLWNSKRDSWMKLKALLWCAKAFRVFCLFFYRCSFFFFFLILLCLFFRSYAFFFLFYHHSLFGKSKVFKWKLFIYLLIADWQVDIWCHSLKYFLIHSILPNTGQNASILIHTSVFLKCV